MMGIPIPGKTVSIAKQVPCSLEDCCMIGSKPLPEQMMTYLWDVQEYIWIEFLWMSKGCYKELEYSKQKYVDTSFRPQGVK